MGFETSLNFTSANEDGQTELEALSLSNEDRVLCLTASGARPLDLLLGDPGEIVAIDSNPAQNHLLRLKIAALQTLDDDELYRFLGIDSDSARGSLIETVLSALNSEDREYWTKRRRVLNRGVWHSGRWERVLRIGAFGNRILRGKRISALMIAPNLEEQSAIWDKHFDDWIWRASVRILGQRWIWTKIIGEPGGAHLPDSQTTADLLTRKFRRASRRFLFGTSDFATLIFQGRHTPESPLPLHLQRDNLAIIRSRLNRITIATDDLRNITKSNRGEFSAYSLSDFGSYCDLENYEACWNGIIATSKLGARYCERIFMNPIALRSHLKRTIKIDRALSDQLSNSDRAIIYDIRAGSIKA